MEATTLIISMLKYYYKVWPIGCFLGVLEFTSGIGPKLSKVAIRIYEICVNSASVEKIMVKYKIFTHKSKKSAKAIPITSEEKSDNSDDDNNQVPADGEAGNPEDEEYWDSIITEWINNHVKHENQFDNTDDATLLSSEWDTDFELGGQTIHPADDDTAKWILKSLFISNLELPTYLDTDDIFTDTQ
ncbi:hypothetical protein C1646_762467 [Rhizophagus diaphanus]|nr:hypothetical protein C1646_762467 [Rhizophagus diaphanus] [Rhizophagus sp. MUCL 43196]